MHGWRIFILVIIAFALGLLDTSFFSFIEFHSSTVLSSFVILIIFTLIGRRDELIVLAAASVVMMAVFSSLSLWAIYLIFLLLPAGVAFFRAKYLPDPSLFSSVIILIFGLGLADLILVLASGDLSRSAAVDAIFFILMNAIFGLAILICIRKILANFRRGEIKI